MIQIKSRLSFLFVEPDSKSISCWYDDDDDDDDASTLQSFSKSDLYSYSPSNETSEAGCSASPGIPRIQKLTSFVRQLFTSKQKKPVNPHEKSARKAANLLKRLIHCDDYDYHCCFIGEESLEVFIVNILDACNADAKFVAEVDAVLKCYSEDIADSPPDNNVTGHLVYLVAAGVALLKQNQGDKDALNCLVPVLKQVQDDAEELKNILYSYVTTSKLYKRRTTGATNSKKSRGYDVNAQSEIPPTFVHLLLLSRM